MAEKLRTSVEGDGESIALVEAHACAEAEAVAAFPFGVVAEGGIACLAEAGIEGACLVQQFMVPGSRSLSLQQKAGGKMRPLGNDAQAEAGTQGLEELAAEVQCRSRAAFVHGRALKA